jgi:uncharacterized protein with GYD domain
MATYITLIKLTEKGISHVKNSPARLERTREAFRSVGADIKEYYMVFGQYDAVAIMEAPDDETASRLALMIGAEGNIRTETMRAFNEDEARKMLELMP